MNVLIISGHPDLAQSVANKAILDELTVLLPEAHIRKLDELYYDRPINVVAEQEAILAADVLVWQFPFYWYSMPGLMKTWLDKVFLHGFAHGSTAKIAGKKLLLSITTGAPAEAYGEGAPMTRSIENFLMPFDGIVGLCKLKLLPTVYTNGVSYLFRSDEEGLRAQIAQAKEHAGRVANLIEAL